MKDKKNKGKIDYKDSVFRYIFSEEKNFIQLYYDLTDKILKQDEIELCTLNSIVINELKNDVAFKTKDNRLIIMVEHQSTINPNMPLRCLLYFAEYIKKFVSENMQTVSIYQSKALKIPAPEFYVVYNGKEMLTDKTLRLDINFDQKSKKLELEVEIVDINYDRLSDKVIQQKDVLNGYSFLVEKVREYKGNMPLDAAIERAIEDTKKEGYLVEYLDRKEFMTMLLKTWTIEEQIEFAKKESLQLGLAEGEARGTAKGRLQEKIEVAKNLISLGIDDDVIVKSTGLTKEQIEDIRNNKHQNM